MLAAAYRVAKGEAGDFEPEAVFSAEQAVAVALGGWRRIDGFPIEFRARLALVLGAEDGAKAEQFTESRRAARLEEALAIDHIKFLREVVLADQDTARLWWLHRNLTGDEPETSWTTFNDIVRPVIRIADENDPVTKIARALLTMNDYVHEEPKRLDTLANMVAFAADKMGQGELAGMVANLRNPAQQEANGSAPAGP